MYRRTMPFALVAALAVLAAGCGTSSPTSPAGSGAASGTVGIQGVVLASGVGVGTLTASSSTKAVAGQGRGQITVTVEGTGLTTSVTNNGTFELTGVPGGTFTLVFTSGGVEIGRVVITAGADSEVKLVAQMQGDGRIIVVQLDVTPPPPGPSPSPSSSPGPSPSPSASPSTGACVLGGDDEQDDHEDETRVGGHVELEGKVASGNSTSFVLTVHGRNSVPVTVNSAAASFRCNGDKNGDDACKASLKAGVQAHVKGTLAACTASDATVTATEVKLQKNEGDDD